MPFVTGMSGLLYLVGALVLDGGFLYYALKLKFAPFERLADGDVPLLDLVFDGALQLPADRSLHTGLLAGVI